MNTFLDGLRVKLASQYRSYREEIKAWVYFGVAMFITIGIFYVVKNYLAQGFYSRSAINSHYTTLGKLDSELQQILESDFTKVNPKDLENVTLRLESIQKSYEKLRLERRGHFQFFAIRFGYDVDEFNKLIEDRLILISKLKSKLLKYKIYLFCTNTYKNFDACIKHLDFSKSDKEISNQLNKCIAPVNITQIQEYSKLLNCEELKKLADYFSAYKNLSRYYYFLSQKRYKEAQKYKEEARKRINVNIKWEKCFDFLGK